MIKKFITNLELSKVSGPDCIPVVVMKKYEPDLSYIPAELFGKCLKESSFPDCWKVSGVGPGFYEIYSKNKIFFLEKKKKKRKEKRILFVENFFYVGGNITKQLKSNQSKSQRWNF